MTHSRKPELIHTYPSNYQPGTHWSVTAAWEILDYLNPGALQPATRALLAGMIAGRLMRERYRCAVIAKRGGSPQIAEAIRHE